MSIILKTSKPRMYSNVLDIILTANMIRSETFNFDINDAEEFDNPIIMRDQEVENYIVRADSIIDGYLKAPYGAPSGLRIDAWVKSPLSDKLNSSDDKLLAIELCSGNTSYTCSYKVNFTNQNQSFSVSSSLEGNQGSGLSSTDFTSSNGDIKIGSNSWESTNAEENDKFYFSIVDCYSLVNSISSLLAASMILSEKYSEAIPNANDYAENLWDKAIELLEKLADPEDPLSLVEEITDQSETVSIDYNITSLGEDDSNYLTENKLDL